MVGPQGEERGNLHSIVQPAEGRGTKAPGILGMDSERAKSHRCSVRREWASVDGSAEMTENEGRAKQVQRRPSRSTVQLKSSLTSTIILSSASLSAHPHIPLCRQKAWR
jgi:hypothetical protein